MPSPHVGYPKPWDVHHAHNHDNERDESPSSLFSSSFDGTSEPEPPSHFFVSQNDKPESNDQHVHNATVSPGDEYTTAHLQDQLPGKLSNDDIILELALPVVLIILVGLSIRHCYITNRRHAQFHEMRQSVRAAQRAETREQRRLKERKRKERVKEIEKALICKVGSCVAFWHVLIIGFQYWHLLHYLSRYILLCADGIEMQVQHSSTIYTCKKSRIWFHGRPHHTHKHYR